MITDKATFTESNWSSWKLEMHPDLAQKISHKELTVDQNIISDTMGSGGVIARAKEPFFGSILNIVLRVVSSIIPNDDLKYAYLLDFGKIGKVDLYLSNNVWSSHADLRCHTDEEHLSLLLSATKEYIRYRCFVDEIQPLEK